MSTIAQVTVGLLLLLTGLVSVIAAILGNPIRLGGKAIPGPDSGPARAIVAGIGTAALAGCAVLFILGGSAGGPAADTGSNKPSPTPNADPILAERGGTSGSVGGLPALTLTPTPSGSPKPPAAPSTAPPIPGKPTVTSIKVTGGAVSSCGQTYRASISVANGPMTIKYVISVGGFVQGPNPRVANVTGSTASLDSFEVDLHDPGEVVYNILSPNLLSDFKTWGVPSACAPAVSVSAPVVLGAPDGQNCSAAPLALKTEFNVVAPLRGINVTYHLEIGGKAYPERVEKFHDGMTPVLDNLDLSDDPYGFSADVRYVVTAPVDASGVTHVKVDCTSPAPPTSPPDESSPADPPVDPPMADGVSWSSVPVRSPDASLA